MDYGQIHTFHPSIHGDYCDVTIVQQRDPLWHSTLPDWANLYTYMKWVIGVNDTIYWRRVSETLALSREEIHDWEAQYTNRKMPQGIVRYQAVMPQGIVRYQAVMPQGIARP